jgi:hypothetical protein
VIFQYLSGLLSVRQTGELRVTWLAEFQYPDAKIRHVFAQAGHVAVLDSLAMGIRLAPDGQAKRIGAQRSRRPRYETGHHSSSSRFLQKRSS